MELKIFGLLLIVVGWATLSLITCSSFLRSWPKIPFSNSRVLACFQRLHPQCGPLSSVLSLSFKATSTHLPCNFSYQNDSWMQSLKSSCNTVLIALWKNMLPSSVSSFLWLTVLASTCLSQWPDGALVLMVSGPRTHKEIWKVLLPDESSLRCLKLLSLLFWLRCFSSL